jgi:hypothetical protein
MRVMPLGHARIGMTELGRDTRHHQARTCSTAAGYVWGLSQTLEMAAKVVGSDLPRETQPENCANPPGSRPADKLCDRPSRRHVYPIRTRRTNLQQILERSHQELELQAL